MNEKLVYSNQDVSPTKKFCPDQLVECACSALAQFNHVVFPYGLARIFSPQQTSPSTMVLDPRRVILGQGTQQLQDLDARMLIKPGDTALVQEPTASQSCVLRPGEIDDGIVRFGKVVNTISSPKVA